ncbi:hypothetical protein DITRI_Ditri01bG0034800 [Diplodiscus trichospermus]
MASTSKKIMLKSSDGEAFEVDEAVAVQSQTIKHMIEDDCADNEIPLPNVTSKILSKVLEYCKKHVDAAAAAATDKEKGADEELKAWDADFVKVDQNTLFDLILVHSYVLHPHQPVTNKSLDLLNNKIWCLLRTTWISRACWI